MSTNNYLTKSAGKLFLLVLIISSFALSSAAADNTIYLLGEHHSTDDQALLVALSGKAQLKKLLLGVELPDTASINQSLSHLNPNGPAYIVPLENTYARIVAHLLYFYSYLTKIENLYQIHEYSALPDYLREEARSGIPALWNDRLCFLAMQESFDLLSDNHREWTLWQQIDKGPFFTKLTQALAKQREQVIQDETSKSQFWLDRKITYSKRHIITLLDELQPILVQLIANVLVSPEAKVMPTSLQDNLNKTDTSLTNARASEWDMIINFGKFENKSNTINNILGDRLRDFYMALRLQKLAIQAEKLNLPLVAVTGIDHTPGIYMFLKEMGVSVEVGIKNNFLKLPTPLAAYAKARTLPALMKKRFALFPTLAMNSNDLEVYFDQEQTNDPEVAAALKVIKKHHDEL